MKQKSSGWKGERHRHSMARRKMQSKGMTDTMSPKGRENYFRLIKRGWSSKARQELHDLGLHQDDYTTSDLQGIVMAIAKKELDKNDVDTKNGNNFLKVMELSDVMLEYVYSFGGK